MSNSNLQTSLHYVFLEPRRVEDGKKPPLLILLHGIGSHEEDLFSFAHYADERFFVASARAPFALPYGGYGWFELFFAPQGMSANFEQAEQSRQLLLKFIDELVEKHDVDAGRVFLCGFSQGAIMSFAVALTAPEKLAGVVAMSGRAISEFLPFEPDAEKLRDFPFLVVHGTLDPVLPIENGRASKEYLEKLPVKLDYREYRMAHQVSEESLRDVINWLRDRLEEN